MERASKSFMDILKIIISPAEFRITENDIAIKALSADSFFIAKSLLANVYLK
jgi:hypothetical protein